MVAAAVGGAALAGAGASIYGSSQAAGAQSDAANSATNAEMAMYNQTRNDLMPYNTAGKNALGAWNSLMGLGGGTIDPALMQKTLENLPGYQFTLGQGLKSTQNSAAARGLGSSGAALKGAANYATGLANSQYMNYANQLMGGAQLGENAAAQTGAFGTQTANSVGNNMIGAGNAQAAYYNSIGNSVNGAANNVAGMYALGLI